MVLDILHATLAYSILENFRCLELPRTRTRTRTWKLVLGDKDFPWRQQHCYLEWQRFSFRSAIIVTESYRKCDCTSGDLRGRLRWRYEIWSKAGQLIQWRHTGPWWLHCCRCTDHCSWRDDTRQRWAVDRRQGAHLYWLSAMCTQVMGLRLSHT